MNIIPFETLYSTDFLLSDPMAKNQHWYIKGNFYSAIGKPKISHTLLWLKNCRACITDKYGVCLNVEKNQLVYTAKGTEYTVEFFDTAEEQVDSVVIHFQLTDLNGMDIAPTGKPFICMKNVSPAVADMIEAMVEEYKNNIVCFPELKSSIYTMLSMVCGHQKRKIARNKYTCIQEGIRLMEQNSDMKMSEIAAACGITECYFRRLFKEYSGESPMEFRQRYRIEKAKQLLLSDEMMTIGEIAEELKFADIYHFSKTFKKLVSMSPSEFLSRSGIIKR